MTDPIEETIPIGEWLRDVLRSRRLRATQIRTLADEAGLDMRDVRHAADADPEIDRTRGTWRLRRSHQRKSNGDRPRVTTTAEFRPSAPSEHVGQLLATIAEAQRAGRHVEIFRDNDGRSAWVGSVDPSRFSLGWLAKTYGGGRYIIEGRDVYIEGPPKSAEVVVMPQAAPAMDPWMLMLKMQEQQTALLTALITRASAPAASVDPVAMLDRLDQMAHRRSGGSAPTPFADLREAIKLGYDSASRAPRASARGEDDDGDGDDPMLRRLLSVADNVTGLIRDKMSGVHPPAPAVLPSASDGSGGQGTVPALPVTLIQRIGVELRPYVTPLVIQARRQTAPAEVAAYIVRSLDEPTFEMLAEAGERPQFVQDITNEIAGDIPPELVPWFTSLAEAMQRELAASAVDDTTDNSNRDRTDDD